jgi:hypothetical protein
MIEKFKTVRELLADKSRWCQRFYARDAKGRRVNPRDGSAVSFCLLGACARVYASRPALEEREAIDKLQQLIPLYPGIVTFNDTSSHAQVLDLVTKAGI